MAENTSSKFVIGSFITCFCLFSSTPIFPSSALSLSHDKALPKEKKAKITADERIQPIGQIYRGNAPVVTQETVEISENASHGEKIAATFCLRCHAAGLMKSPKMGRIKDWAPRLKKGTATLYANAINGLNKMPARGGKKSLSDNDVKAAVDHMLELLK